MSVYFGKKIKEIRKKNKLTQLEFAKVFGYKDKSMIAHIENGDSEMSNDRIALLIEKFGVDANELFIEKNVHSKDKIVDDLINLLNDVEKEQKNGVKYYSIDELDLALKKILKNSGE